MKITRAWKKATKRGPRIAYGLVPSEWVAEVDGDKVKRRVYQDWSRYKPGHKAPLVIKIKGEKVHVSPLDLIHGEKEAERLFKEFWEGM